MVLKNALKYTGKCEVVAPQSKFDSESPADHQPGVLIAKSMDSDYAACLDPLGKYAIVFEHLAESKALTGRTKKMALVMPTPVFVQELSLEYSRQMRRKYLHDEKRREPRLAPKKTHEHRNWSTASCNRRRT